MISRVVALSGSTDTFSRSLRKRGRRKRGKRGRCAKSDKFKTLRRCLREQNRRSSAQRRSTKIDKLVGIDEHSAEDHQVILPGNELQACGEAHPAQRLRLKHSHVRGIVSAEACLIADRIVIPADTDGWSCGHPAVPNENGCLDHDLLVEFSNGWSHLGPEMNYHSTIDDRSRAFGRAVAARLSEDEALIERAGATLARWLQSCSPQARPALLEWKSALERSVGDVIALLTDSSEQAVRLRQSNPFAGVLPQKERLAILRQFAAHE